MASGKLNMVFTGSFDFPEGMAGTKRVKNILHGLVNQGVNCKVLLLTNRLENPVKGTHRTIPFFTIMRKSGVLGLLLIPFRFILGLHQLSKWYDSTGSHNVLYVYSGINIENLFLVIFARMRGYKIVVDLVEDFSLNQDKVTLWRGLKNRSNVFFNQRLNWFSNGVVVISTRLKKLVGGQEIPLLIIPVTAGNLDFQRTASPKAFNPQNIHILYSGTYGQKDGIDNLLDAFRQALEEQPKLRFVLTGNVPHRVKKMIAENGIEDRVFATGFLDEEEYYNTIHWCDILCMTRINSGYANAGFPFKLGEYLATGNLVVATDVSDVGLYMKDEINGYLIDPEQPHQLTEKLKTAIRTFERSEKMRSKGRKVAETHFNPKNHASDLISFVNNKLK